MRKKMIEIKVTPNTQVMIVNERINKAHALEKDDVLNNIDTSKSVLILRFFRIKKLKEEGFEHILDILRYCFVNNVHVVITEMNETFISQLPKMKAVSFYKTFEDALEHIDVVA